MKFRGEEVCRRKEINKSGEELTERGERQKRKLFSATTSSPGPLTKPVWREMELRICCQLEGKERKLISDPGVKKESPPAGPRDKSVRKTTEI